MTEQHNAPLRVRELIATRKGDPERGPAIWMCAADASYRLMTHGELVWVRGPRRNELATLFVDDTVPRGDVVLRDIVGASPSETVKVNKVDTDTPSRGTFA